MIVLLAAPIGALAGILPDGGITAPEVASGLKSAGYPADVTSDRSGQPSIQSSTGKQLFFVRFFQCDEALRCASVQFTAAPRHNVASMAALNAWNRQTRFARAFQDGQGVTWLAMDLDASHGMTTEALAANIQRWTTVLAGFATVAAR